jgi:hypothetical protein
VLLGEWKRGTVRRSSRPTAQNIHVQMLAEAATFDDPPVQMPALQTLVGQRR